MYDAIYGNIYRETLWELNMEYMPFFPSRPSFPFVLSESANRRYNAAYMTYSAIDFSRFFLEKSLSILGLCV